MRVPTQETIVLLCLRLLYNEGAEKGYFVDSSAQILVEEEEIQTVFSSMGSRTLKPGELRTILTMFKRKGLVTFDQSHSLQVSVDITIRPTITEVVDGSFLARMEVWGGQSPGPNRDGDGAGTDDGEDTPTDSDTQFPSVERSSQ
jgi:hypothetical protein